MLSPKNILVVSQKGGVGKTTVADEIAYSLERTGIPFAFYDYDGQGNAAHRGHKDDEPQVVIVDTPGRLEDEVVDAIASADVVVVPTRATGDDMRTIVTTLRVVRNHTDAPIVLVVNCMNRFSLAQQFSQWIESAAVKGQIPAYTSIHYVSHAEAVPQARAVRKSIVEYQKRSKSASEVLAAVNAVRRAAGLPDEVLPENQPSKKPLPVSNATKEKAKAASGFASRMRANRASHMSQPGCPKELSDNQERR